MTDPLANKPAIAPAMQLPGVDKDSFAAVLAAYPPEQLAEYLSSVRQCDVEQALSRCGAGKLEDFLALISPAASSYLPLMARESERLTRQRFGQTIKFFIPIYLSNECQNVCTYCGFSYTNPMARVTLTRKEVQQEITALKQAGFDTVLILTGEHSKNVDMNYFREMIPLFREHFSEVLMEVQPLSQADYSELATLGVTGITVYQETYHPLLYRDYHLRGKKRRFAARLATPERAGAAGMHKIGIGALLGLAPWRLDSFFVALHYQYLKKRFWQCEFTVSFPRLRPAEHINITHQQRYRNRFPNEQELKQLIFAYRLWDEDLGLSLSTRESAAFRNFMIPRGITNISAGSATNPGGYACYPTKTLEQFSVEDTRSPSEMVKQVQALGLDPVFKDWMTEFALG